MIQELKECRFCGCKDLEVVLDLGSIYPSAFLKDEDKVYEDRKAPLQLCQCSKCSLVQLKHTVDLDLMYRQYWYSSSLNKSMVSSLENVVYDIENRIHLWDDDVVLDIGCNDGTLLNLYSKKSLTKVGFDPAFNIKRQGDFIFVNDYFNIAQFNMLGIPKASVITAIAMFYDLPDPNKFLQDVKNALSDTGIFVVQLTDLLSMFKLTAFDNICHEHLEYYSLAVLRTIFRTNGLEIIDVSYNNVNGGSVRVTSAHPGIYRPSASVKKYIDEEAEYFSSPGKTFADFEKSIYTLKRELGKLISDLNQDGKSVYLMGASTKGNTLLQIFDLTTFEIKGAAEVNQDKFGLRTVGTDIKIMSEIEVMSKNPDYLLILPWHFTKSIVDKHKDFIDRGGKFIVPLPEIRIIGNESDIRKKSIGFLIDELITTDLKCWYAQEDIMRDDLTDKQRADAAVRAQQMNARRNQLIRAIDLDLGQGDLSPSHKTYHTYFKDS